jgi:hypothetical protein
MIMKKMLFIVCGIVIVCFAVTCRKKDKNDCPVCPQITDFSPGHGKAGTLVTINGSNFATNPDGLPLKASINGFNAVIKKVIDNQVQITIPSKCGTGTIRLYYDDELTTESSATFIYDVDPIVSTFAGGGSGSADNANPLLAGFIAPEKVFLDVPRGIVYVIEQGGQTLRKIDATGTHTLLDNATPNIRCGTCDQSGNVYLGLNGSIARLDHSLNYYFTTIAGKADSTGHKDGAGSIARFHYINDLITDAAGNMYVAEDSYVRKVDGLSFTVSTIAGTATTGFLDGPALSAKFDVIFSLAIDNVNNLYIADWNNNRMRKLSGGVVSTFAGNGVKGIVNGTGGSAQLQAPRSVVVDGSNTLYFSDSFTSIIRKITLNSGEVSFFSGSSTVTGDVNGVADTALFNQPSGFAYDKTRNILYAADYFNSKIKKITFE